MVTTENQNPQQPEVRPFTAEECIVSNNIELIGNGIEKYDVVILDSPDLGEKLSFYRSGGRKKAIYKYFEWLANPKVKKIYLHQKNSMGIVITRELNMEPAPVFYKDEHCAYFYGDHEELSGKLMDLLMDGHVEDLDLFAEENVVVTKNDNQAFFVEFKK